MALQDILQSIQSSTDDRIAEAKTEHRKRLTELRSRYERETEVEIQQIEKQKTSKLHRMQERAKTHGIMLRRHAVLRKKQEWLIKTYDEVLKALAAMSEQKAEAFLRSCLKQIPSSGTIHPSEKHKELLKRLVSSDQLTFGSSVQSVGGFIFSSPTEVRNFTLEFLVQEVLRPNTELETARALFPSTVTA